MLLLNLPQEVAIIRFFERHRWMEYIGLLVARLLFPRNSESRGMNHFIIASVLKKFTCFRENYSSV